jgi:uncharacterized protein YyaL (SSP411 family)
MRVAPISWLSWSTDAFQRAHGTGRPVLLSIVTGWSAACRAMDAEVFAQSAVVAAVEAHAVPVRVDADQRPDIADRYGLGGWPTTVWLTPDGEMLTGGTYVDAGTLASTVVDVCARFQRDRAALVRHAGAARAARQQARVAAAAAAGDTTMTLAAIRDGLMREFDPEHGGFGRAAKFPLAAPLLFALRAGVLADDAELIAVAETTLDHIAAGALTDPATGAFHRACAQPDWTDPDPAHLLDVQAEMIGAYLEAYRLLHHDRYRARAVAALEYVARTLREGPHGAFYHFEPAREPPLIATDSNARLIRTLVQASDVLGDNRWILAAVDIAERLLPVVYVRASGVAHYLQPSAGRERALGFGLLADAIFMASALLDLGEAAGQPVYVELAEELGRSCVRRFWDAGAGAFVDRVRTTAGAGDVGLLGEPLVPFGANVEAARLIGRLAVRTQDAGLASRARDTVRYVGAAACREGILSSDYGLLLLELGQNRADGPDSA